MIKLYKKIDPVLILLSLIAAILLFTNLDNIYLWVDEAETAVLGRNILTYGYPRAFDGTNTLNLLGDSWKHFAEYDQNYIWTIHPWLEFYVTAASFMLLGITTFAARFLFALAGLGSVLLNYSLSQHLFQNKTISRISTGLLVFSVPFLLHMRQCRYYALITFFTLWMMLSYLRFVKGKKHSGLELGLSSVLLFHSNYGPFISVGLAVTIHYFIFFFKREQKYKFLGVLIPVCLLTIPWLFYLKSGSHVTELSLENLRHQLEFYVRTINKYIFPLVFFILVSFYRWFRKKEKPFKEAAGRKPELWLLVSIILASVFLLLFVEQRIMRYMIHIVPLLYILEAVILTNWLRTSRGVTICVLMILVSTNMLHHNKIKFPLLNYLGQITHDYDGPNEAIVKFLAENAQKGDTVKVSYSDRPIIFYNKELFVSYDDTFEKQASFPEWIIPRRHWVSPEFWDSEYYQKILSSYEKIELNCPDLQWGNRPEPGYHKYRTVVNGPSLVIFKRKKPLLK